MPVAALLSHQQHATLLIHNDTTGRVLFLQLGLICSVVIITLKCIFAEPEACDRQTHRRTYRSIPQCSSTLGGKVIITQAHTNLCKLLHRAVLHRAIANSANSANSWQVLRRLDRIRALGPGGIGLDSFVSYRIYFRSMQYIGQYKFTDIN